MLQHTGYRNALLQELPNSDGFGSSGRMHLAQTFSYLLELSSTAVTLKVFKCRKQAGRLQREQRPPPRVANWCEQTQQRHGMDSEVMFD